MPRRPVGRWGASHLRSIVFASILLRPSSFVLRPFAPPLSCRTSPPQGGRSARRAACTPSAALKVCGSGDASQSPPLEGEMSGRTEGGAKGRRTIRICHRTCSTLATLPSGPGHCSVGKRGARPCLPNIKTCATLAPRWRFLFPPVSLLPKRSSASGLCAFYRHAGVIVPPGEPPDGTSPAMMPRRHHGGGAGSSPRNHRHDRCSRWEELATIMDEGRNGVDKRREEKCGKRGS
jgi:hypothetical protein